MDHTERRIVREKLHTTGVISQVLCHELYRCTAVHGEGLTEKEVAYIVKRRAQILTAVEELGKFSRARL